MNQLENFLFDFQKSLEKKSEKIFSLFINIKKQKWLVKKKVTKEEKLVEYFSNWELLRKELWNVPNVLSFSRVILGPFLWLMIVYSIQTWIIFIVLTVALLTDWLDGIWARMEGDTVIGSILDPWCDKILFLCLAIALRDRIDPILFWVIVSLELILFITPILGIVAIKKGSGNLNFRSNIFGKFKYMAEGIALIFFLFQQNMLGNYLLLPAILLAALSIYNRRKEITKKAPVF